MKQPLPFSASEITVTWRTEGGGIGVTAHTDDEALPYIGLYPINGKGEARGLPVHFQYQRLMIRLVVGFIDHKPSVVFLDAEVSGRGLSVHVCQPWLMRTAGAPRFLSARWNDDSPLCRYGLYPAKEGSPP